MDNAKNIAGDIFCSFKEKFPDRDNCQDHLIKNRTEGTRSLCSSCEGQKKPVFLREKGKLKCRKCRKETAMTFGTAFFNSKVELLEWYKIIWAWVFFPAQTNAHLLSMMVDLPLSTTFGCLRKLREVFSRLPRRRLKGGFIEIDVIGVKEGGVFRGFYPSRTCFDDNDRMVLVAVTYQNKGHCQVRMLVLDKLDTMVYDNFLAKNVMPSSEVERGLSLMKLLVINTGKEGVGDYRKPAVEYSSLESVNAIAVLLNEWMWDNYHGSISTSMNLQGYLDEFCIRRNNRDGKIALFEKIVKAAALFDDQKSTKIKNVLNAS
jgi:hypothetical protein